MNAPASRPSGLKTPLRDRLRRLAFLGGFGLFLLYVAGVTAGYLWLRHGRKNEQIGFVDVALFRVRAVQRAIAAQHFARAQVEWDAKNYQVAYLSFSSALSNDPANIPGRLAAAGFFRAVGATSLGLTVLEDGLARAPEDPRLIKPTFDLLLGSGRDRHALDLLRRRYGTRLSGPNAPLLQTYEIQATLKVEGVAAARKLLEQNADLPKYPPATPVVARVLWESSERLKAIELLAQYLRAHPAVYDDYAQLAGWQAAGGQPEEAIQTAQRACEKFPQDTAPRVLLLEMRAAAAPDGRPGQREIENYLRDFAGQPEPLAQLAMLAGRKGWVDLARTLYEVGANGQQPDLALLALFYADALARNFRFAELLQVLAQIEAQASESSNAAFMLQLRLRQLIAAASLGDSDNVREFARRLAAALRSDPGKLETYRQYFQKMGQAEVVAELTPRSTASQAPVSN